MVMWRNVARDCSLLIWLESLVGQEVPITWKTFTEAITDARLEEIANKLTKLYSFNEL